MLVSGNEGGTDVKHPKVSTGERGMGRQRPPPECRGWECVHLQIFEYMHTEYTNKCMRAQVCTSLPVNMSVYVFGLPSVPQQRPSELFSRSLATLIMSGPPQSINQPSAAPLNPQTEAQGRVRMCVCVYAGPRLNY